MPLAFTTGEIVTASKMNQLAAYPARVTALPGSPVNEDECIFTDSLTAPTYYWHLRYNSNTAKWYYLGGVPLFAETVTFEATASTTYVALATAGPSIALPVAGDWFVTIGHTETTANGMMSYDIGGTAAVDADSAPGRGGNTRIRKKTGLTAVTLTAKYRASAGTVSFGNRYMMVEPVRLG